MEINIHNSHIVEEGSNSTSNTGSTLNTSSTSSTSNMSNISNLSDENKVQCKHPLTTNDQWISHINIPMIDKKYMLSLYDKLKDDKEFIELVKDVGTMANDANGKSTINNTSYYVALKKDNVDVSYKMDVISNKLVDLILKEKSHSYTNEKHLHTGFPTYLQHCWDSKLGIILRPDIIHNIIVSETIEHLFKNKRQYQYDINGDIDVQDAINEEINVNDLLKNNGLKNVFNYAYESMTTGSSDALHAMLVKNVCIKANKTAYEQKIESDEQMKNVKSDFSNVCLSGKVCDWDKLLEALTELITAVPNLTKYYTSCKSLIGNIKWYVDNVDVATGSKSYNDFFSKFFYINETTNEPAGYFTKFYIRRYNKIEKYPSHIGYIMYSANKKNFVTMTGLTYSEQNGKYLIPKYGHVEYEVLDDKIFISLAGKEVDNTSEELCKSVIESLIKPRTDEPVNDQVDKMYQSITIHKSETKHISEMLIDTFNMITSNPTSHENYRTYLTLIMMATAATSLVYVLKSKR